MRQSILGGITFLCLASFASAQEAARYPDFMGNLNLQVGIPMEDF